MKSKKSCKPSCNMLRSKYKERLGFTAGRIKANSSMRLSSSLFLFLFIFLSHTLFSSPAFGEVVDRIAAIINEDIVTLGDLEKEEELFVDQLRRQNPETVVEREKQRIRREVLNNLIDKKLTEQEAKRLGIFVSEEEVDAAIEDIIQRYGVSKEQLAMRLKEDGVTMARYRETVRDQVERVKLVGQAVKAKIVITDDRLRAYYEKNRHRYESRKKYRVQHIVFAIPGDTKKEAIRDRAESVLKLLRDGGDFEGLARQFSTYSTASEGGDLGYVVEDELAPYMKDLVTNLKKGEISPLVETPIGYQVFKVTDIVETKAKPFEEVRDEIYRVLFEQDANVRFAAWLKELRDKSYVETLL